MRPALGAVLALGAAVAIPWVVPPPANHHAPVTTTTTTEYRPYTRCWDITGNTMKGDVSMYHGQRFCEVVH